MTTRRMRFAYWIARATDTHSEYVIGIAFQRQQCVKAPECYVLRTLPVLFDMEIFGPFLVF
jgi:hypothetical protein